MDYLMTKTFTHIIQGYTFTENNYIVLIRYMRNSGIESVELALSNYQELTGINLLTGEYHD